MTASKKNKLDIGSEESINKVIELITNKDIERELKNLELNNENINKELVYNNLVKKAYEKCIELRLKMLMVRKESCLFHLSIRFMLGKEVLL